MKKTLKLNKYKTKLGANPLKKNFDNKNVTTKHKIPKTI